MNESDATPEQPQPTAPPVAPPKEEVFWGWHDVFLFIFITVMSLAMTLLAATGIKHLLHLSAASMNIVSILSQFVAYGVAFTCLKLMFQAEYGEPLMPSLNWIKPRIDRFRLAMTGLAQAVVIAEIGAFMHMPQLETPMSRLLADRPTAIVIAILGVTVAPLAEELAFRGLLQPLLIRSIGVVPGILGTSILFGLMHLEQYGAWQSALLISLAGVGFGVLRQWSGSTQASALMHAGYNSALFILFFTQKGAHG